MLEHSLRLFTGNRLEVLAEKLAETVREPMQSPLDEEIVIVQSKGMERWVSMRLARHNGICANVRFPFPNRFVYECFRDVFPELPEQSPFDPAVLTWRIMKSLPECLADPDSEKEFGKVRDYLRDDAGGLKRFQLSERIANAFDQYLLYRPEMIFRWVSGKETHWQARLFAAICKDAGKDHRPALGLKFVRALENGSTDFSKLPERVSVFGISSLPRFHMEILRALSSVCRVDLFLMNPCREYWGDILTNREMKRAAGGALETDDLHLEQGNRFLASMGSVGRDFFDLVNEFAAEEAQFFDVPDIQRLLLGYAMTGNDQRMFEGILPYDDIEGTETWALGKFLEFVDRLFSFIQSLEHSRTPVKWVETLITMTDLLFLPEEDMEMESPVIRRALADLGEIAAEAKFDEPVFFSVPENPAPVLKKQRLQI